MYTAVMALQWWLAFLIMIEPCVSAAAAEQLEPIVWSVGNPIFRRGLRYIVQVRIEDTVDIICPEKPKDNLGDSPSEYYRIYLVSKSDYEKCDTTTSRLLLNCDQPSVETKFTFLFTQLSPVPNDFIFQPCQDYHLISTSNATEAGDEGMENKMGGVCRSNNMRIIIRVSCTVPTYSQILPYKTARPTGQTPQPKPWKFTTTKPVALGDNSSSPSIHCSTQTLKILLLLLVLYQR
ncbi:ephrin b2-like protein isoform X1 [Saccoglossus kowalevskii]|uniref:Ephrin B-like protein n=1 Tax=Saccoglossus kowalevskii TaxID=10224 RepID=D2XMS0_SACKO|nr:ephrin b2-like protein precursor [Saccoglossus kowalevskii]ADB22407.1 ephrin b2-like protein [Saccoglossus kowalevskii]ANS11585.1 ephrin B-like protein [Saccoglossus kowalevskii]